MATIRVRPWKLTLTILDGKGKKARHTLHLNGNMTFDQVQTWASDYIDKVEAIILGAVVSASVSRSASVADAQVAAPGSDREMGLKALYNGPSGKEAFRHYLATVRDDLFMDASAWDGYRKPILDNSDAPEIAAWRNRMVAAEALGYPATPTDARGKTLVSFRKSYQVFKKS